MITNASRVHLCCPTCFRFHPKLQRKLTKMKPNRGPEATQIAAYHIYDVSNIIMT